MSKGVRPELPGINRSPNETFAKVALDEAAAAANRLIRGRPPARPAMP